MALCVKWAFKLKISLSLNSLKLVLNIFKVVLCVENDDWILINLMFQVIKIF